jgi:hypothetical protein
MGEEFLLLLKTLPFLHSHSDQITATTLTQINNQHHLPSCQKILATLCGGGYNVELIWMTNHIALAICTERVSV